MSNTQEINSSNWAGNVATGHPYTDVQAQWHVPAALSDGGVGDGADESTWVGIGQGGTSPLIQAGSESPCCSGGYALWWQIVPTYSTEQIIAGVSPGDFIGVHITRGPSSTVIHIADETTLYDAYITYHAALSSDGTAEWIGERPAFAVGSSLWAYRLAHTGFTFTLATAAATTVGLGWTGVGSLPHYYHNMWTCGNKTELAYPGSITNGNQFAFNWKNYGVRQEINPQCVPGSS